MIERSWPHRLSVGVPSRGMTLRRIQTGLKAPSTTSALQQASRQRGRSGGQPAGVLAEDAEPQTLADVLAAGDDADGQQIKNLADGTDPQDAATVAQLPATAALADVLSAGNDADGADIVNLTTVSAESVVLAGVPVWKTVAQTADQAVVNSSTPVASELTFALAASTKYRIRGLVHFETTGAADFLYSMQAPAAPTLVRVIHEEHPYGGPTTTGVDNVFVPRTMIADADGFGYLRFDVLLHNLNAGSFTFAFAQGTPVADTGAIMSAGSYLEYAAV